MHYPLTLIVHRLGGRDTDMANRGMLPKFRPAALGGREAVVRPTIRPVKPAAPPPPPAPPRRFSSGIRRPDPSLDSPSEVLTASFSEPPTMAAARERVHAIARELPREQRFDDETQARPADEGLIAASRWSPARRAELDVPYEALPSLETREPSYDDFGSRYEPDPSTMLRPEHHDDYDHRHREPQLSEPEPPPAQRFGSTAAYGSRDEDSGPRQRPRKNAAPVPHYDVAAYEANYPGVQREEVRREPSYPARGSSYQAPQSSSRSRERDLAAQQLRDDGFQDRGNSWSAPQPQIPPAPPIPREMNMPSGFVMGVQPLRTPAPSPAYVPPQPQVIVAPTRTPMMGVPYAGQSAVMGSAPRAFPTPAPAPAHVRQPSNRSVYSQHPIGHQLQMTELEEAQQGSKVGRFAWFVFGAAFGIFFAFFATGFVPRLGKKEEAQFPPPPPVQPQATTTTAPPVQALAPTTTVAHNQPAKVATPPAVKPAAPPPPAMQPPAPQPQVAVATPAATPVVVAAPPPAPAPPPATQAAPPPPQPVAAAPAPAPKPTVDRSPPPAPRGQRAAAIARRSAPPAAPKAPKPMPNSGSTEADDAPAPAPKTAAKEKSSGGADLGSINNLLSAGLGD